MSLDVYLTTDKPITRRGTGVFIREGGKNKELTPDEVLDRWPDTEVTYRQVVSNEVFTANITHNMGEMARKADIYMALWRPDEEGWKYAKDIISILEIGLERLKSNREYYEQFNPDNGWGSYDGLVEFVTSYLEACKQYPDAVIEVSR